jgi:hypothetical protein
MLSSVFSLTVESQTLSMKAGKTTDPSRKAIGDPGVERGRESELIHTPSNVRI